jgi:hypothetical protein
MKGKYIAIWKKSDDVWIISKMVTLPLGEDEVHDN